MGKKAQRRRAAKVEAKAARLVVVVEQGVPMIDVTINCWTVEDDRLVVERDDDDDIYLITVVNPRDKEIGDGRATQRATVHFTQEKADQLIRTLGGVTRDDIRSWQDANPQIGGLVENLLKSELFPELKEPCEHKDIKLEEGQWAPGYEPLHGECAHCGAEMRLDLEDSNEWEVQS